MKMKLFKYENGYKAKDMVTGLKGVITARVDYLTGCNQYALTPDVGKDNSMKESYFIDESRIEILSKKPISFKKNKKDPGGPVRKVLSKKL